jgi:WD40 repeat protein
LLAAAGLAACSFLPPQPATPLPALTATAAGSATASVTPTPPTPSPTPSPTFTPTAVPQPISLDNAAELQVNRDLVNYDQAAELFSAAASPDGSLAAAAGCEIEEDQQCHVKTFFRLFDLGTGEALLDLDHLSPAIEVLAFSPDGSVLAAAGCDISLYLYGEPDTICDLPRAWLINTETGAIITELKDYTSHVLDFVFSPDGSTLYTSVRYDRKRGDGDHVIRAYDARTGQELAAIETGMITCTDMYLGMSPDGRYLTAKVTSPCGSQSFVAWWEVSDLASPVKVGHVDGFTDFRISSDSTQALLYNIKDQSLKLYDLAAGTGLKMIPRVPYQHRLRTFDYLRDRDTIVLDVTYEHDVVDLVSGRVIQRIQPPSDGYVSGYLLTPDRRTLFVLTSAELGVVSAWDTETWESVALDFDQDETSEWYRFLTPYLRTTFLLFSPDRSRLVEANLGYGDLHMVEWGFAAPGQDAAAQALNRYLSLLATGDYDEAAAVYIPYEEAYDLISPYANTGLFHAASYLEQLVPEVDPADTAGALRLLCQDEVFPCLPVRDFVHRAQITEDLYLFTVSFTGSDGQRAEWPACADASAMTWCKFPDGGFPFYVLRMPDGSYRVVNGFPPAIELRTEN